jgi:hypothetical protein
MKIDISNFYKRILITQLLSILFAVISNIHTKILIKQDWMFDNQVLFYTQLILLVIIFSAIIMRFMDGRWINGLLISIPYIVYFLVVLVISSKIFPTNTDPDDFGVGLIVVFASAFQWISVVIGCIVGTYIKRKILIRNK